MHAMGQICEAVEGAKELARDALHVLETHQPLPTAEDLEKCATVLMLQAATLRAAAVRMREIKRALDRPRWWRDVAMG